MGTVGEQSGKGLLPVRTVTMKFVPWPWKSMEKGNGLPAVSVFARVVMKTREPMSAVGKSCGAGRVVDGSRDMKPR